jgi:hypothetical protein
MCNLEKRYNKFWFINPFLLAFKFLKMTKLNKLALGVLVLCFATFYLYVTYNARHAHKEFYCLNLSNEIEAVQKTQQGYFELSLDSGWVYLWTSGACIDTIQAGDSIFKPSNSFEITIKRKIENYRAYKYTCSY